MKRNFLLAFLLVSLLLSGCGSTETTDTTAAETMDPAQTEPVETEPSLATVAASYSDRDYGGYTFRILDRGGGWVTQDVYAEELTGEVINDAIYNRNTTLEETLNIVITESRVDVPANILKQSVTAGTDDYDTATDGFNTLSPLTTQNMLIDFRNVSTIHADAAYWDPMIYEDCSIMGKSFFMTGDISIMDNMGTWCMLFNKDMIVDNDLENPYTLVDEGKWTLDKMDEMASVVLNDADGDGKWTAADTYGFVTEGYNNMALWSSTGFRVMETGEDGLPAYVYNNELALDALVKVLEIQYAPYTNLGSKSTVMQGGLAAENSRERQFADGRALFYYAGMTNITSLRDYDTDFGIIPSPKYSEEQSQYSSNYSYSNMTVYVIPTTSPDVDRIGDIMDAMANMSVYTLTPAYYDQTLIGKSTRDEESEPMIDLILRTRNFDLGIVFGTGGIRDLICSIKDPGKVTSSLATKESAAKTALEKFIADISAIQ